LSAPVRLHLARRRDSHPCHRRYRYEGRLRGRCRIRDRAGAAADSGKVRKLVQEKIRATYPQVRNNLNADNFMKDKHLGNHAVVVSAAISKPGCKGRAMGVGFGKDEAAARKDAERLMGKMFPFNDGKVKVEFSKALNIGIN
jgi:hypothetical protein